jgi:hypothetical protein
MRSTAEVLDHHGKCFAARDLDAVLAEGPEDGHDECRIRKPVQEITTRLPGRTTSGSAGDLASALRRAEAAHGEHEKRTGQRDASWPEWYAAYMVAEHAGQALVVSVLAVTDAEATT